MNKKSVMILTPPLTSPSVPSFTAALAAGCFLRETLYAVVYDANLDFFTHHVFLKRVLEKGFKTIIEKKETGLIPNENFKVLDKILQSLSSDPFSTDFFRSETFYDPEKYAAARNRMDDLLLLYSAAFYPSRIRWRSLSGSVMEDTQNPLFLSFCHENLEMMLKQFLPDVLLLALDSESQILAANTIIQYVKAVFPAIHTVVLQDKHHLENNTLGADHCFSLQNLSLFLKWINKTFQCKHKDTPVEPDFSKFPLKEYLAPELILPLQTGFFKDIFSFRDFVAKLKDRFGARGFLFDNPLSSFDIFSGKKEFSHLFFGVQALVEDLDMTDAGNENQNLFSSGTILIQWKHPGEKRPLKIKNLWDFSKQGIWNHVNLTGLTDDTIKNDWLRFISLNPNIAHSYENLTDPGPYDKPDLNGMDASLQAYSGVKQLPGKPFWNFLSDPAHLLLYLNRHGKKDLFCLRADKVGEPLISRS